MCPFDIFMSTAPDKISFADLQSHLDAAAERTAELKKELAEERKSSTSGEFTEEEIQDTARQCVNLAVTITDDPMVHKSMMCMILHNMIEWHTRTGTRLIKERYEEQGQGWLRDAGIFQCALFSIASIVINDNDFIAE